jgi:multicomponent Na+:H+ antiporter subunit B
MGDANIMGLIDIVLLSLLVVTAFGVVLSRNLLTATIFGSIFSLLMAGMYLVMGAPDVAITEAAVGAGISTILFLSVLLLVGYKEKPVAHPLIPIFTVAITAGALVYVTLDMPAFGDKDAVTNNYLVPYFLNQTADDMGFPNVVTAILASYRGFDTFGEVVVVFTAAMAALLLLGGRSLNNLK